MPDKSYAITMARYNHWQNQNLITASDSLSDKERTRERGAFFGSIHKTLSHVYWGDSLWMSKFIGTPSPPGSISSSVDMLSEWEDYRTAREELDAKILRWSHDVIPEWFEGDLTWYSAVQKSKVSKPKTTLVIHFFNHQTHHRGQVHAMLTAAGAKPGDTDLAFIPKHFQEL